MNSYLDTAEGEHDWVYEESSQNEGSTEKYPMLEKNKAEPSKKNFFVRFFSCFGRFISRSCLTLFGILLATIILTVIFLILGYVYSPTIKNMILILYAEISKSLTKIWETTKNIKLIIRNGTYFWSV
ncbi:hypothetical protein NERG_02725 [Nematocida ausubeli]|uniref:Uncharacterized protein n=1 Tax=Nematocida ausubeli (strain ATCC PRA-371 / ERTm2) TaxID=1913371 RepID=H8ZGK4_NEMA1|nr:hypothetical protein NERG_02725 [Nematocida ausubeli]